MNARVLIVDDESDILDTLRETFEYEGFDVITAADGATALARVRAQAAPPQVAVIDLLMPTMGGRELYEAMRDDPQLASVPVIFCTSAPAIAPPGTLVMKKPIDLERLVDAVRRHCMPPGPSAASE